MKELRIKTPAKINFGLNIISKRDDGFHNIETIFYPVNLFDEIIINEDDQFSFNTTNSQLKNGNNNSVINAKELFSEYTGIKINSSVTLEKNIPMGAGMGGGSSDGAAALIGFNNFYNAGLSPEELSILALRVGSDVPFFIDPKPKFATSRGEVFEPISLVIQKPILIVNPGIHISTAWAFSKIIPQVPIYSLRIMDHLIFDNFNELKNLVTNDFESIVFSQYPEIGRIKENMYEYGAEFSLMTGSGSTIFGIFPDQSSAMKAASLFSADYFTFISLGLLSKVVNPLHLVLLVPSFCSLMNFILF
jgi:4-diphosphocytidyl-2-C-methyl-D-erythritol kinase